MGRNTTKIAMVVMVALATACQRKSDDSFDAATYRSWSNGRYSTVIPDHWTECDNSLDLGHYMWRDLMTVIGDFKEPPTSANDRYTESFTIVEIDRDLTRELAQNGGFREFATSYFATMNDQFRMIGRELAEKISSVSWDDPEDPSVAWVDVKIRYPTLGSERSRHYVLRCGENILLVTARAEPSEFKRHVRSCSVAIRELCEGSK